MESGDICISKKYLFVFTSVTKSRAVKLPSPGLLKLHPLAKLRLLKGL